MNPRIAAALEALVPLQKTAGVRIPTCGTVVGAALAKVAGLRLPRQAERSKILAETLGQPVLRGAADPAVRSALRLLREQVVAARDRLQPMAYPRGRRSDGIDRIVAANLNAANYNVASAMRDKWPAAFDTDPKLFGPRARDFLHNQKIMERDEGLENLFPRKPYKETPEPPPSAEYW